MKKLSIILICLILLSTIAFADEISGDVSEIQEKPSSTPGKFTWGLQRLFEKIKLATMFSSEKKAEYGLQLAEKRLAEIQELAASNNTENMEKSSEAYLQQIEQIKEQIAKLKDANSEKEFRKLTFFQEKLLRFEDKIQRLQSFVDTKTNLTTEQQEKLNELIEKIKEKEQEMKEKLDERENKTKEKLNLTEDELQKIRAEYNITQLKQDIFNREIQRLQLKEQKLREIANNQKEKGKNITVMESRLDAVNANIQKIQSSDLSIDDKKELIKETQQLLNFRQVYKQDNKDISAIQEKIQKELKNIQEKIVKERKEVKKEVENKNQPSTGIANPASVYCEKHDGTLEIRDTSSGQVGYCKFSNGSECEEWAYYRGECKPKETTNNKENENKTL